MKQIRLNLQPYFQEKLITHETRTVIEMEEICCRIEEVQRIHTIQDVWRDGPWTWHRMISMWYEEMQRKRGTWPIIQNSSNDRQYFEKP